MHSSFVRSISITLGSGALQLVKISLAARPELAVYSSQRGLVQTRAFMTPLNHTIPFGPRYGVKGESHYCHVFVAEEVCWVADLRHGNRSEHCVNHLVWWCSSAAISSPRGKTQQKTIP